MSRILMIEENLELSTFLEMGMTETAVSCPRVPVSS